MNSFRLSQQIELTQLAIQSVTKQIIYVRLALKFGFATTWLLYFIFVMGFYVSDIWGIASWLTQNTNEYIAFTLFLLMALLMATTLGMIKHVFYEHRAEYKYGLGTVIIIAALGIFFELFNASSQQQNIAYHNAENSKAFQSTADTTINIGSLSDNSAKISELKGELAQAQTYLDGCKKTCQYHKAKVESLKTQITSLEHSQSANAATAERVSTSAIKAKSEAMQVIKDDYFKPVFKFVRDNFKLTISTAVVLIATMVAAGFEYSHALLSKILGDKLNKLNGLQQQLINEQTRYAEETGATYQPNQQSTATINPIGFNIPQVATAALPKTTHFKYQDKTTSQQQPIGFIIPKVESRAEQIAATNRVHTPTHTQNTPNRVHTPTHLMQIGTAEEQIPLFGTYLGKALATGKANSDEEVKAHLASVHSKLTETVCTQPPKCVHTPTHPQPAAPTANSSTYKDWLVAVHADQCKPTVRDTRTWVQKRIAGKGSQATRRTSTPVDIDAITTSLFQRAIKDPASRIIANPDFRQGKPKYLLLETTNA